MTSSLLKKSTYTLPAVLKRVNYTIAASVILAIRMYSSQFSYNSLFSLYKISIR
jgi:hypothetical protein